MSSHNKENNNISKITLAYLLKTSRPGLWFATLWLYLLPTSQMPNILTSVPFWVGLFYVCFPLNLMVYGWNDAVDQKTDAINPRKDSYWFGALGNAYQLKHIWKYILAVQLITYPVLIYFGGIKMIPIFLGFLLVNGLYNLPEKGLRSHPPFELLCQVGYLLIVPLSIFLNDANNLPLWTYGYLCLFAVQSHLMGEVMDIVPDKNSGRETTATKYGIYKTKFLIILIVTCEVNLLFLVYNEIVFGGLLAFGLIWLLLDVFLIYKSQTYSLNQMQMQAYA